MQTPLAGVIFDLDGTLVDSAPDIRNALNEYLRGIGRRSLTLDEVKAALGDGAIALCQRALGLTGGNVDHTALVEHVHNFVAIYRAISADPAQIYPGVVETLRYFRARNVALGLCTNKPEAATHKLLDDLELRQYFGAVAGGDTFMVHKPDPGHIRGVIERLGVAVQHCVMVGDSVNDLAAARGLNIPCVWVDYGYGGNSAILQADASINDFAALPEILAKLGFSHPPG